MTTTRTRFASLLVAVLALTGVLAACSDEPEPRDLDAYVCGDAQLAEDDRESDPQAVREADCIEVYDETDADEGEVGELVGRFERVG